MYINIINISKYSHLIESHKKTYNQDVNINLFFLSDCKNFFPLFFEHAFI